jgi:16S rRNA A1518/A1519 N6-dimethyltransferase RsmA/KsgA/DIM1 with predicted DNA glycosylase/AP lyase activity
LGENTLEIGPGYGANLRALADKTALTALEIDNPVDPAALPDRLRRIGFTDVHVDVKAGEQRWRAVKP